jgi:hypothetical protein
MSKHKSKQKDVKRVDTTEIEDIRGVDDVVTDRFGNVFNKTDVARISKNLVLKVSGFSKGSCEPVDRLKVGLPILSGLGGSGDKFKDVGDLRPTKGWIFVIIFKYRFKSEKV